MKAIVCTRHGPAEWLEYRDIPEPQPGPSDVLIAMQAASVNFPDVLIIQDKYQFKPALPFVPGSELAGTVTAVGRDVRTCAPGDRVMAFTTWGAFAESVCVDAARVVAMPAGMEVTTAASLLVTYGTMDHALRDRAGLREGETVLVLGAAGGVGLAAIEVARALGARVIAAASSDERLATCREVGAHDTVNYARDDWRAQVKALTEGRGVNVVVDPVGGEYTEPALRSLAWRGRLLVIGFAAGQIPRVPLNLVLLKGASIVGVFWGDFLRREPEAFAESVQRLGVWHREGKLRPRISQIFPLARAAEALTQMAERGAVGKLVLVP